MSASLPEATTAPAGGRQNVLKLCLMSLGVVYGDIGTSPLYALRECFLGEHAVPVTETNVLGILSLVFWALVIVISGKYLLYVLRADNHGEGGILALMALALSRGGRGAGVVTLVGLFGAALLYGDGVITPAISVLGAVEGLEIVAHGLTPYVVPISVGILVALFSVQARGTGRIGSVFGPVTLVWFVAIAVAGVARVVETPTVLWALNPAHAVAFLASGRLEAYLVLGAVFLVVTGGEALYADMGHFGRRPIRLTWFVVVMPALLANYFGQGAALLADPAAAKNPFYLMLPSWALLPMVCLATAATVIASQALISGVFSLTRQAAMLGFWPRVRVLHTSHEHQGQVYLPGANWLLLAGTVAAVFGFESSSGLAGAYCIAVTMTMVITTLLAYAASRRVWGWSLSRALAVTGALLVVDVAFLGANLVKIDDGGWFPLGLGLTMLVLFTTWKRGRALLGARMKETMLDLDEFRELMRVERPARVPGCAVYMTSNPIGMPPSLVRNFEHNRVVHASNVLLTVTVEDLPHVPDAERSKLEDLGDGFVRVTGRYGFMDEPDVPALLAGVGIPGFDPEYTTYVFGQEILLPAGGNGMSSWRKRLFALMARNSQRATAHFKIPADDVIELSSQVKL